MTDAVETARLLLRRPTDVDVDVVWRIPSDPHEEVKAAGVYVFTGGMMVGCPRHTRCQNAQ